jgi:hypothetical protein
MKHDHMERHLILKQAWIGEPAAGKYGRSESPFDPHDHQDRDQQHDDDYHPE